jgi:hypothetical protein
MLQLLKLLQRTARVVDSKNTGFALVCYYNPGFGHNASSLKQGVVIV